VDLHLLNGLPPVSCLFDLSFQIVILHLLLSVFIQFYIPRCYAHLFIPFPLPRSIPLSLTVPRPLFFLTVSFFTVKSCRPTSNLEGHSTVFTTPGAGWPSYTPGSGYPIWSPFTTYMGYSSTVHFPRHHTGSKSVNLSF
jgi:hypothetical protein